MKHLFLFLLTLSIIQAEAQVDRGWYINNQKLKTITSFTPVVADPIMSINIEGVSHPLRFSNYPNYLEAPRNDIFIIYRNGDHFNSRYLDPLDWRDYGGPMYSDYSLRTNEPIQHLYYTNVYEGGDEPQARVTLNQAGSSNYYNPPNHRIRKASNLMIGTSLSNDYISTNHSVTTNRDITLIINHSLVNSLKTDPNLNDCKYNLCFTSFSDTSRTTSVPTSYFNIIGKPIFGLPNTTPNSFMASDGGSSNLQPLPQYTVQDSCINNISFNPNHVYTYVNLEIPNNPAQDLIGDLIVFSLTESIPGCGSYEAPADTIRDSHDPNFIEVECVNVSDNISTIHYKAYCMNDGEAPQPNPSIEFTFPYNIDNATIDITHAKIRSSYPISYFIAFNENAPALFRDNSINRIKFDFSGSLLYCPVPTVSDECAAWVRFCVKVPTSEVNALTDNLQPFDRNTNFGETQYKIIKFIDKDCVESRKDEDPKDLKDPKDPRDSSSVSDELSLISLDYCQRINEDCDCTNNTTKCCWYSIICNDSFQWIQIGCIIFILILLGLIFKLFKKKSKG